MFKILALGDDTQIINAELSDTDMLYLKKASVIRYNYEINLYTCSCINIKQINDVSSLRKEFIELFNADPYKTFKKEEGETLLQFYTRALIKAKATMARGKLSFAQEDSAYYASSGSFIMRQCFSLNDTETARKEIRIALNVATDREKDKLSQDLFSALSDSIANVCNEIIQKHNEKVVTE